MVCRSVGLPGAISFTGLAGGYGQGTGPIQLDDLNCLGTEDSLLECTHKGWGNSNCLHNEDVSVVCEESKYPRIPSSPRFRAYLCHHHHLLFLVFLGLSSSSVIVILLLFTCLITLFRLCSPLFLSFLFLSLNSYLYPSPLLLLLLPFLCVPHLSSLPSPLLLLHLRIFNMFFFLSSPTSSFSICSSS